MYGMYVHALLCFIWAAIIVAARKAPKTKRLLNAAKVARQLHTRLSSLAADSQRSSLLCALSEHDTAANIIEKAKGARAMSETNVAMPE